MRRMELMAHAEVLADAFRELGLKVEKVHNKPSVDGVIFKSSSPFVEVIVYRHGDVLVSSYERETLLPLREALEYLGYKTTGIYVDSGGGLLSFTAE